MLHYQSKIVSKNYEKILPYSRVSNNRRVWNNRIGWMFPIKLINVGYGIVVLGGNF